MTRKDGLTKVFKYFIGPVIPEKLIILGRSASCTISYNDEKYNEVKLITEETQCIVE